MSDTERPWFVMRCPCCGEEIRKRVDCVNAVRRAEKAEAELRKLRAAVEARPEE